MVMIMIMSITLAVAMPAWSAFVQREKEAEAIFRGLQYAEAIRVFQQRHGRLPTTLEELVKVEPRAIRQLYTNPLNESGKWGLLMQTQGSGGAGAATGRAAVGAGGRGATRTLQENAKNGTSTGLSRGGANQGRGGGNSSQAGGRGNVNRGRGGVVAVPPVDDEEKGSGRRRVFGTPKATVAGPLVGVYAAAEGTSMRSFNGATSYNEWRFQSDMIPAPVILGGEATAPRVTSDWIGKPFRSDLQVQQGQGVGGAQGATPGRTRPGALPGGNDTKGFRPRGRGGRKDG